MQPVENRAPLLPHEKHPQPAAVRDPWWISATTLAGVNLGAAVMLAELYWSSPALVAALAIWCGLSVAFALGYAVGRRTE